MLLIQYVVNPYFIGQLSVMSQPGGKLRLAKSITVNKRRGQHVFNDGLFNFPPVFSNDSISGWHDVSVPKSSIGVRRQSKDLVYLLRARTCVEIAPPEN